MLPTLFISLFWGAFCDWYIEMIKPILYGDNEAEKAETRAAFAWVFNPDSGDPASVYAVYYQ